MVPDELPDLLTYDQAAKILQVSKATLNRYSKQKINPLTVLYLNPKYKRNPRIRKSDLKAWIESLEFDGLELV